MASSSRINLKERNETDGEYDDNSACVPGFDGNNSDLGSCGSDSDVDDHLCDILESNEDVLVEQCRVWYDVDMKNIPPAAPRFPFTGNPDVDSTCKPVECFELYFDQAMIDIVVRETNRYAEQFISTKSPKREMLRILILQGIVKLPRQEWHWSKRKIIRSSIFPELMSRNMFLLRMKFMHFTNNDSIDLLNHPNPKLWNFFDILLAWMRVWCSTKAVLDGKCSMRKKEANFGLKFFVLCETDSGYICDFLLYTGKSTVYNEKYDKFPISAKVVLHLMDQYLNLDVPIKEKTDIYGTVNSRRKDLPQGFSKEYRLKLVENHIEKYSDPNNQSPRGRSNATPNPLRLTARHFASHILPNPVKKELRRQSAVCCAKKNDNGKHISYVTWPLGDTCVNTLGLAASLELSCEHDSVVVAGNTITLASCLEKSPLYICNAYGTNHERFVPYALLVCSMMDDGELP
ncbi:hypothetical protein PR048_025700 [Dryococelus australis]|uniref:PiggyBac transposable element-derived protein domain-containing protein n=1 Tax=Dryococelus australis TaxID=614101 RepID=A0ABQ9GJA1_9NEOP|nr:hypothetical protein PR048_025700 [Dryococelus australis]